MLNIKTKLNSAPKKARIGNFPMFKGTLNERVNVGCLYLNQISEKLIITKVRKTVKFAKLATVSMSPIKINNIEKPINNNIAAQGVLVFL